MKKVCRLDFYLAHLPSGFLPSTPAIWNSQAQKDKCSEAGDKSSKCRETCGGCPTPAHPLYDASFPHSSAIDPTQNVPARDGHSKKRARILGEPLSSCLGPSTLVSASLLTFFTRQPSLIRLGSMPDRQTRWITLQTLSRRSSVSSENRSACGLSFFNEVSFEISLLPMTT